MRLEINQHVQIGTRRYRVTRSFEAPPLGIRLGRTAAEPAYVHAGSQGRGAAIAVKRHRGLVYELPFGTFIRLAASTDAGAEWYELTALDRRTARQDPVHEPEAWLVEGAGRGRAGGGRG